METLMVVIGALSSFAGLTFLSVVAATESKGSTLDGVKLTILGAMLIGVGINILTGMIVIAALQ